MLKQKWSNKLAFILASAGAAVGIGNIWRFPYIVGENGGGTFIVLYLFFTFAIGVPILIAEIVLGRNAGENLIDGLKETAIKANKSRMYSLTAYFSLLTLFIVLSFYSVVSGWILFYLKNSVFELLPNTTSEIHSMWSNLLNDYKTQIVYQFFFIFLTLAVVARGIKNGLEKINNILMPALFILLGVLVLYSGLTTGKFIETSKFLFHIDLSNLNKNIVLQALGQACFSLAVGAGAMFVYGSYLEKNVSITSSALYVAAIQFSVGILAGFAIFPIIFSKGLPIDFGSGLIFVAMPSAFNGMAMSNLMTSMMLCLLSFAALTSAINIAEPIVSTFSKKFSANRNTSSIVIGLLIFIAGIPYILSFNILKDYHIFGSNIFDFFTKLATNLMLPIGAFMYCIYAGYILPKKVSQKELSTNVIYYNIWYFSVRYLVPIALFVVLI